MPSGGLYHFPSFYFIFLNAISSYQRISKTTFQFVIYITRIFDWLKISFYSLNKLIRIKSFKIIDKKQYSIFVSLVCR